MEKTEVITYTIDFFGGDFLRQRLQRTSTPNTPFTRNTHGGIIYRGKPVLAMAILPYRSVVCSISLGQCRTISQMVQSHSFSLHHRSYPQQFGAAMKTSAFTLSSAWSRPKLGFPWKSWKTSPPLKSKVATQISWERKHGWSDHPSWMTGYQSICLLFSARYPRVN